MDGQESPLARGASGGASLSAKLALALSLFLAPLAFVTLQLVAEQQKAIAFANAERDGVVCLAPVANAELLSRGYSGVSEVSFDVRSVAQTLETARDQCGARLGIEAAFSRAVADLESAAAVEHLRVLRRDIGDYSNLILDPDLDSYYVMDVVVAKLPAVLDALQRVGAEARVIESAAAPVQAQAQLASSLGLLSNAREDLEFSLDAAVRGARDNRLRDSIAAERARAGAATDVLMEEITSHVDSQLRGRLAFSDAERAAARDLDSLHRVAAAQLDRLLRERIERFESARFTTLSVALTLFCAALCLTIWMLRRGVVHPIGLLTRAIRRLAEGDYDRAVPLQARRDEIGEIARALEVLRGVAKEKIAADSARVAAESASQAKSHFIANMSHELRTPLNAVIGFTEMVIEDLGPESEPSADLHKVTGAARHLLALINDILDLAKVEAGKEQLSLSSFDVSALMADVLAVSAPAALTAGAVLVRTGECALGAVVSDERRLKQCLLNLIANACRFAPHGRVEVSARRASGGEGEMLEFKVADTGAGMNSDQLSRLFRPFEQVDSSIENRRGGTGLGLAITRTLARSLGGDVTIESTLGVGTVATLRVRAYGVADALLFEPERAAA